MRRRVLLPFGCGVFVLLASCNTFDDPPDGAGFRDGNDDGFGFAGPLPASPVPTIGSPSFAGSGVSGFGAGGFGPAGSGGMPEAASGGRGGWQLLDGGVPPVQPEDDAGDEDAGN